MAFLLYSKKPRADGFFDYECIRGISLAGNTNGLIYQAIKDRLGRSDFGWTLGESELLSVIGKNTDEFSLISDPTPDRGKAVMLLEILSISGYTSATWTPIMLRFKTLFDDDVRPGTATSVKRKFSDRKSPTPPDYVHTFLYLQGGYSEGTWNWGRVGQVNGPLLWKKALRYFVSECENYI